MRVNRNKLNAKEEMASGWTSDEVQALIEVWGAANVQNQLDGEQRNRPIFEKISKELLKLGYSKTWLQCRTKIKNMTQQYRKVRVTSFFF